MSLPVEKPARAPLNRCRTCAAEGEGLVLHHDPASTSAQRTICGKCQGEANGRIMGATRRKPQQDGGGDGPPLWWDGKP